MTTRLLVANRGEIARRVFATCRRLGIETVAVHSDADAGLPFVREADLAVRLRGHTPAETYLRGDLVIDAALRAGADAIHPGYGFLSESAGFARAVLDAGLTWIGPPPEAIEAMGSKIEAKRLMARAGVPVLEAPEQPTEADLPLLVKASAGGGGRGMRVVRSLDALEDEVIAARAEAESAFGDGTVFVEPYVEHGRHVEVQVVAGGDGGVVVFGDRDCSVQRRHQKVVEEAPAPALPQQVRKAMHLAAADAAAAIDYRGAGTVEFLYDAASERFWFLEMNTRLQVEHPVTEAVFGVDLVELQLAAAEGRPIVDLGGADWGGPLPAPSGHAVEVRLYAEDPSADHSPQSGRLVTLAVPGVDVEFGPLAGPGLRLDSGFESGSEVSTHYDAMLAKLIAWAPTREQAVRRLVAALRRARIHGLTTNRDQLVAILEDVRFTDPSRLSTRLLTEGVEPPERPDAELAVTAAALMLAADDAHRRTVQRGVPAAWRNVTSQPQRTALVVAGAERVVEWYGTRDGLAVDGIEVLEATPSRVRLGNDGVTRTYAGVIDVDARTLAREVFVDGPDGALRCAEVPRFVDPADQVASGSLLAPMPGTVVKVAAEVGQRVAAGDVVLVLEAMKMQHQVTAPTAGRLTEVSVAVGAQVASGDVLAVVEPDATEGDES